MTQGKHICRILKEIRRQIAEANNIDFITAECNYKGDCRGTCPRCEAEVRFLERQLRARSRAGKVVTIAGISAGLMLMSGCTPTCANKSDAGPRLTPNSGHEYTEEADMQFKEETAASLNDSVDDGPVNVAGLIERPAIYPGGWDAFYQFLSENLFSEGRPGGENLEGRVRLKLRVDENGRISLVEIMDSTFSDALTDSVKTEMERVVKLMPDFAPATVGSKPMSMNFAIPITFRRSHK